MFESPADEHINNLIEHLCDEAQRLFCSAEDRQSYVDQIAQLRASQNPIVNLTK